MCGLKVKGCTCVCAQRVQHCAAVSPVCVLMSVPLPEMPTLAEGRPSGT